jgi:hypothetical protein
VSVFALGKFQTMRIKKGRPILTKKLKTYFLPGIVFILLYESGRLIVHLMHTSLVSGWAGSMAMN